VRLFAEAMNTQHSRRWGAVLVAGGLCAAAAYSFYPSTAHSALIRPAAALALVGMVLMIPGLIVLQSVQAQRSDRARTLGWSATGLICVGIAALEFPHLLLGLFDPQRLFDLDSYHASIFGVIEFPGVILISLGEVLMAVAMWRARVYPRRFVGVMVLNILVSSIASSVPAIADAVRLPAPNYLLVGALGLALLARTSDAASSHRELATPAAV
jgi:hypothetical protein